MTIENIIYMQLSHLLFSDGWDPTMQILRGVNFAAAAKLLQLCPTQCDPIDGSPSGSTVPGILQARTLERVAISFSNVWKWKVKVKSLSRVRLLATPWTAAYQAPLSTGFSRQEHWSGVPLPSPGVNSMSGQTFSSFCLSVTFFGMFQKRARRPRCPVGKK